jgi:hypothetical protein
VADSELELGAADFDAQHAGFRHAFRQRAPAPFMTASLAENRR